MQDLSLFEIAATAFILVIGWLLFLTLYSRRSDKARKRGLMLIGVSLIVLGASYLAFAILLYVDGGYLYYLSRGGGIIATAPDNSLLSFALAGFLAVLPPALLVGFGWLVLKASRAGANNSVARHKDKHCDS